MDSLIINIDWPYFLGIMGSLLVIAWYAGSRFSKLDTAVQWIKRELNGLKNDLRNVKEEVNDQIGDLRIDLNNSRIGAYSSHSPIHLTAKGQEILEKSGLKTYIDTHLDQLKEKCAEKRQTNPYEVQEHIFSLFNDLPFEESLDQKLKEYAFNEGVTMEIIRRSGAIYFRDICLQDFGMKPEDIDGKQE